MSDPTNVGNETFLVEHEAKALLSEVGIRVPQGIEVAELPQDVSLRFPVVLKVSDPGILHKTDVGGVKLGVARADLKNEFESMKRKFADSKILIEEMQPAGAEFIVGVVRDPLFGQVIMLGTGGIYTEMYGDVTFRKIPITEQDAEEMLAEIKSKKFCSGFRGIKIDCRKLTGLLLSVSNLVSSGKRGIETMDLNPVIVTGNETTVVDAKISLRE